MAQMVGKNARVHVWYPGGQTMELDGCVVNVRLDQGMLDVTSFYQPERTRYVPGIATVEMTLRGTRTPGGSVRRTLREQMALAVLDGDEAAARALADMLCEDVARASRGRPTHEELTDRAAKAELDLAAARARIDVLESRLPPGELPEELWDEHGEAG